MVSRRNSTPYFLRNPLTVIGLAVLGAFALCALLAPVIAPYDPLADELSKRLRPPSPEFWLGSDSLGRDLFSRLVFGARISLFVGVFVVVTAGVFGSLIGVLAGYAGGLVEEALMRVTDVFFAFPSLILAMAIAAALGRSLLNTMIAIAVVTWPVYARLVRGQVLSLREREYVTAARSLGAPTGRIIFKHLLPNSLGPILVNASLDMGGAILAAAGLSFIGFGAAPPTPEWGVMVSEGRQFLVTHLWLPLYPGIAILLVVAAFNLIGDGLRDTLDPQLRGRR